MCCHCSDLCLWQEKVFLCVFMRMKGGDTIHCVWESLIRTVLLQLSVNSGQSAVKMQHLTCAVCRLWSLNCSWSVCRPCVYIYLCTRKKEGLTAVILFTIQKCHNVITKSHVATCSSLTVWLLIVYSQTNADSHIAQPWWQFESDSRWCCMSCMM